MFFLFCFLNKKSYVVSLLFFVREAFLTERQVMNVHVSFLELGRTALSSSMAWMTPISGFACFETCTSACYAACESAACRFIFSSLLLLLQRLAAFPSAPCRFFFTNRRAYQHTD
jgi:hypothetical protein